jgi:hypothetical protein
MTRKERDGIDVMGVCFPWSTGCHIQITNERVRRHVYSRLLTWLTVTNLSFEWCVIVEEQNCTLAAGVEKSWQVSSPLLQRPGVGPTPTLPLSYI